MHSAQKIRIAIVRQKYSPHGGAERFVQNMIDALREHAEVEITLITRKWSQSISKHVQIIECNPFHIGRLWRDWSFFRKACQIINQCRNEFDLVQSHERILCADIYRAGEGVHREWLLQRQRVRPWWNQLWDKISPYHRYILRQERLLFESPQLKAIIVNSQTTRTEIEKHFPNLTASLSLVPNAVDLQYFHPQLKEKYRKKIRSKLNISEEFHVSLFVGSGYERKGVDQLLKSFVRLDKKHHLILVGKDKHQTFFEMKAKKMGLGNRTHFLGAKHDVRPYLGASDLFVFPSLYDPLPNSALEAAATGLPVIASKTTGAADLTESSGVKAPDPLDTNAWIGAIQKASNKKLSSANLMENTRAAMSQRLWNLYQHILEEKK